jgi:CBS domain containing-hemolysin-like protein
MWTGLIVACTLVTLLAGTAVVSVRTASRSRLIEALRRIDRAGRLDLFDTHEQAYAVTTLVVRQFGIVLFVILVARQVGMAGPWHGAPLQVGLISAGWLLFFGAIIPTALARYAGEGFLARTLPALELVRRVSWPVLGLARVVEEIVRRLVGVSKDVPGDSAEVEREILDALSHGEVSGGVDEAERDIIRSAMTLDETLVGEIMTPRTDMVGIEEGLAYDEVRRQIIAAGHSRTPVFEETIDHVVGILYTKDLLAVDRPEGFSIRKIMRPATFVPETKDVASCLKDFQADRVHIAIVLDEYGGTAGLVTIEDILEELVGEIADEHDELPPEPIRMIDDRTAEVEARVRIEEINQAMDIQLPGDESYDTIAGFVLARLGRIPKPGESLIEADVRIEVIEARDRSIRRLRVTMLEPASQE